MNFFSLKALQLISQAPRQKVFLLIPISYTIFIQTITGIPKPSTLKEFQANQMLIRFSEELFDYPFWLQDLSHAPLFFCFAWTWLWVYPFKKETSSWINLSSLISISYAIINELSQAFIPQRFPSIGDLLMNLLGVILAIVVHEQIRKSTSSFT
ncbi:MAG: VanZ family protein [Verrucomicrobiota bacterium]|nr:VanZ family protein [Verrucomicrobiota bacterium]